MGIVYQPSPADTGDCGTFYGTPKKPQAGQTAYTVTYQMASGDLANPQNCLLLYVEAATDPLGVLFEPVAVSPAWKGGPGQTNPSLTYPFPVNQVTGAVILPTGLRGVLVNGLGGGGNIDAPPGKLVDNI